MKQTFTLLTALLLTTAALAEPHGLQVKNNCFIKAGRPYRGVGANYFDLFRLTAEANRTWNQALAPACGNK